MYVFKTLNMYRMQYLFLQNDNYFDCKKGNLYNTLNKTVFYLFLFFSH